MIGASLLAYGMLLAVAGQWLLAGRGATRRAPRLGVLAWQVATCSGVLALVAGGLVLALPVLPMADLGRVFAACADVLRESTAAPQLGPIRAMGFALAAIILARAIWCIITGLTLSSRQRREHAETLRIVGRSAPSLDAVVLDSDSPLVYCLPGRARRIVVTSAALRALSSAELRAVLAHERAHLAGRHHLPIATVRGLARAFPGVPLFERAAVEVPRLLEMCADDAAAAQHGQRSVAAALHALNSAATPAATLGATGTATQERLARLSQPPRGRATTRALLSAGVLALLVAPLFAAIAPLLADTMHHLPYCPLPLVVPPFDRP